MYYVIAHGTVLHLDTSSLIMKIMKQIQFIAKVWLYPGESANWHFVTLPPADAMKIKVQFHGLTKGFGSLPVTVTIGETTWQTSIFSDKYSKSYLLPLKAVVRKKEDIFVEDEITVSLTVST